MSGKPCVCFLGLMNLPVLAPEYETHGIGGEQVQHTLIGKALVSHGYRVSMVVADYQQPDGAAWSGIHTFKAFRFDEGLPVLRFIHPRWTKMWAALKRADADIYYVSSAGMHVGLVALFCRRYGRKLVYRVAHDNDCNPEAVKVLVKYGRDRLLYRLGLRKADAVLVQSQQQRESLLRHYGVDSEIAAMLVTEPAPERGGARDIDVLWVNNLRQFKRPDLLIELARALPHLRFHMIGGEEEGHAQLYREMRRQADMLPNLCFHGRVPYSRVQAFYERARIFVNTSDSEGFPNSFLQAWVRGTPVISFFDPDRVIERHQLGCVPGSLAEMIDVVRSLAADDAALALASGRCLDYMKRYYDNELTLHVYRSTFERLARDTRRDGLAA